MSWTAVGMVNIPQQSAAQPEAQTEASVYVPSLTHTSDGQYLVCPAIDGWVNFCDRSQIKPAFSVYASGNQSVASPRGIYHAVCGKTAPHLMFSTVPGDKVVRGWDLRTQKVEIQISNPHPITALDLGMDDQCLVTGSTNGVSLWFDFSSRFVSILMH